MSRRPGGFFKRWLTRSPCLVALALACATPAAAEATEPLRITDVQVEGGEGAWHASNMFRLDWTPVPGPPVLPRAVLYRLFDSAGQLVAGPIRNTTVVTTIDPLTVPERPDAYWVEAWLEDVEGRAGPPAYATLRFDNAVPARPAPAAAPAWLSTRENALLQIGHPSGPLPVSGIRGYAVALDQGSGGSPCQDPSWCSVAETDLPGGAGDDSIALGPFPEGITYARVVAVSGSGVASPVASVPFCADGTVPRVSLEGLPSGWSRGPVHLSVIADDELSGMAATGPGGPFAAIAVDGGAPALSPGDSVSTWIAGSGVHQISFYARDAAGNVGDGTLGGRPAAATLSIDEEPPRVTFVAAQDPEEPERIEATVTDPLSGPSQGRGAIRLRQSGSRGPFEELPTKTVGNRLIAHWESDSYPPGKYEFLAVGYDRAGNAGTGSERARGAKMVLVNPLKAQASLEAGFGDRRQRTAVAAGLPRTRTVRLRRGVRLDGRLRSISGNGLSGLEVVVTETLAPGSDPRRRITPVRTDSEGNFSMPLPPGPSRDVAVSFAGTRTLTRASAQVAHLDVLTAVRLRASGTTARIGAAPIVFSGNVGNVGAAGSVRGVPVELQFRYPGADWAEFRTVEAAASGRFRYPYKFSDDDSRGVRFQFRAYVKGREGWPYRPAFSRPVAVTGR